jgi:tetratricopeptide (TPR) repeat protein
VAAALACLPVAGASAAEPAAADADRLNTRGVQAAQAGQFEAGVEYLREALARQPDDARIQTNLAGVLTDWAAALEREGRVDRALAALEEAERLDPASGLAAARLGDLLYFRRSAFDQALAAWRRALPRVPEGLRRALADRISQAERDRLVERDVQAQTSPHFDLRIARAAQADWPQVRALLEAEYARLSQDFGGQPGPPRITVIVYSAQDLQRLYYQRDWAVGFYDGRLRLRDAETAAPEAPAIIAHELTHVFLQHVYGDGLPLWVHEGYAQAREGTVPGNEETRRLLERLQSRADWIPLEWLDRRFSQPASDEDVHRAYAEARVAVETLLARGGPAAWHAFLRRLAQREPVASAFDAAFAPLTWAKANHGGFE